MRLFKLIGPFAIAIVCAQVIALDTADARRGGGGGMRGGGMRAGGVGGAGRAGLGGPRGPHISQPIARPGAGNRPGWDNRPVNRPGYGPGYGYRPGYGWGAAAALGTGLAYSAYNSGYYNNGYYDEGAYSGQPDDAVAECARRYKTYDPASQTYIRSKGVRASCP
jgi:BA14K-like protein